jgi:hypothetical protein
MVRLPLIYSSVTGSQCVVQSSVRRKVCDCSLMFLSSLDLSLVSPVVPAEFSENEALCLRLEIL